MPHLGCATSVCTVAVLILGHRLTAKSSRDFLLGSLLILDYLERKRTLIRITEGRMDETPGPQSMVENRVDFRRVDRNLCAEIYPRDEP